MSSLSLLFRTSVFFHWLLCSAAGAIAFVIVGRTDWPVVPVLVAVTLLFPKHRYEALFVTGVSALLVRSSNQTVVWGLNVFVAHTTTVVLFAGLIWLSIKKQFPRWRIILFTLSLLLMLALGFLTQKNFENRNLNLTVHAYSNQFGLLIPFLAMTLASLRADCVSFSGVLASLSQAWSVGLFLAPVGTLAQWQAVKTQSFDETCQVQRSGLWLLFAVAVFGYLRSKYVPNIGEEEKTSIWMIQAAMVAFKNGTPVSTLQLWQAVFTDFGIYFIWVLWSGLNAVATMRLAGFPVFRNTYRLHESRTFAEFFERYQYFYKELVFKVAFWPAFVQFRGLRVEWRVALSLFLSVGVYNTYVNVVYRWAKRIHLEAEPGILAQKMLTFSVNYLIYSTLLVALLYPSVLNAVKTGEVPSTRGWRQFGGLVVMVGLFAAIRVFERYIPGEYLLNWRMFFRLLGLF